MQHFCLKLHELIFNINVYHQYFSFNILGTVFFLANPRMLVRSKGCYLSLFSFSPYNNLVASVKQNANCLLK